jgi:hypothetical protein
VTSRAAGAVVEAEVVIVDTISAGTELTTWGDAAKLSTLDPSSHGCEPRQALAGDGASGPGAPMQARDDTRLEDASGADARAGECVVGGMNPGVATAVELGSRRGVVSGSGWCANPVEDSIAGAAPVLVPKVFASLIP